MSTAQGRLARRWCHRRGHPDYRIKWIGGRRYCTNCDSWLDKETGDERTAGP